MREVYLAEIGKDINHVQLLKAGTYKHAGYGDLDITKDTLLKFKENFENNILKIDLAVDYFHKNNEEAAGWIKSLTLKEDNTELWIDVDWTKSAETKLSDREIRYLSADFTFNYIDNETGKEFGPTLKGAGLTNRPFVKGMEAILSDLPSDKKEAIEAIINKKETDMNFEELMEEVKKLSSDNKMKLGAALGFADKDKKMSEIEEENKRLSEELEKKEKERKFDVMLSEGKVVEAQREPYLKGDMDSFASLKADVNLSEKGNGNGEETAKKLDEKESAKKDEIKLDDLEAVQNKVIELAEAMIKEDKDLGFTDAVQAVLTDTKNKDLADAYQAGL